MQRERLIRRYEHNYFTGWVVRVKREGQRYPAKYFSDKPDGPQAALDRAREYRDELVARLPKAHKMKRTCSANTTGVIGVARVTERTRAGTLMVRYVATWPRTMGGRYSLAKKTFSVGLYGESGARRRAIEARRRGVAECLAEPERRWL